MGWSSGWVSVIDTEDWSSRAVFAHGPVPVGAVRFSPLGDQLVVTGGGAVSVWALTDAA